MALSGSGETQSNPPLRPCGRIAGVLRPYRSTAVAKKTKRQDAHSGQCEELRSEGLGHGQAGTAIGGRQTECGHRQARSAGRRDRRAADRQGARAGLRAEEEAGEGRHGGSAWWHSWRRWAGTALSDRRPPSLPPTRRRPPDKGNTLNTLKSFFAILPAKTASPRRSCVSGLGKVFKVFGLFGWPMAAGDFPRSAPSSMAASKMRQTSPWPHNAGLRNADRESGGDVLPKPPNPLKLPCHDRCGLRSTKVIFPSIRESGLPPRV